MSERNFSCHGEWTLAELFSGDHRAIVIPDLQRDYCWGDAVHTDERKDLVGDFVRNLFDQYCPQDTQGSTNVEKSFNLGLIYGYEQPTNQLQLCDGQQRITTLFLLIGMLNRQLGDDSLKRYLISAFEENDDCEPYLRYSIRETSLYFMSDLVCRYFVRGKNAEWPIATDRIPKCEWYYGDYEQDPSICSMLKALSIIEREMTVRQGVDWCGFAGFLLNQLTFLYYDMGTRENGEETFVVINTTGEPLSAAQNLKPKIALARINEQEAGLVKKWEEMEAWFWTRRRNGNDTSDVGFGEFLRWVTLFHFINELDDETVSSILDSDGYSFPVDSIPFSEIYSKFCAVRKVYEKHSGLGDEFINPEYLSKKREANGRLTLVELYRFLPAVRFVERFPEAESACVLRVFRYFANVARYQDKDITVKNRSVSQAVRLVERMTGDGIVPLSAWEDVTKHILPDEERRKLIVLAKLGDRRNDAEEAFWGAQNLRVFQGEISMLVGWAMDGDMFRLEVFNTYVDKIKAVFEGDDTTRDLVRRALLSYDLKGYPVRDGKNLAFCGKDWQWKTVVSANKDKIRLFLDELLKGVDIQSIIERYPSSGKWSEIATTAQALAYCQCKNVQEDPNEGLILVQKTYATTWFSVKRLTETRERFGAERVLSFNNNLIQFVRQIDGRLVYLQRLLKPAPHEADLYLMTGEGQDSYVTVNASVENNDLAKYKCMRVSPEMSAEEISTGIRSLIVK